MTEPPQAKMPPNASSASRASPRKYRRNGCSDSPNRYQVSSWLLGLSQASLCYAFVFPNFSESELSGYLCVYSLLVLLAGGSCMACTVIDPSDPGVKHARNPRSSRAGFPLEAFPLFCVICQARVQTTSKHCRLCDRCTAHWDHHCVWMNNCVARANYVWFCLLVLSVEAVVALQTYCVAQLVTDILVEGLSASWLLSRYDIGDHGYTLFATLVGLLTFSLLEAASLGFLLMYHVVRLVHTACIHRIFPSAKVHPTKYSSRTTASLPASQASKSYRSKIHLSKVFADSAECSQVREGGLQAEASIENEGN